MIAQLQERREMHRAFLLGKSSALRPPIDRDTAVAQARQALSHLSDRDAAALIVEQSINAGEAEAIVRTATLLMSAAVVAANRLPPLSRSILAQQFASEAERLAAGDGAGATRH